MAKIYEFEGPDGKTYQFEGPDTEQSSGLAQTATNLTNQALNVTKQLGRPPMTLKEAVNPVLESGPFRQAREASQTVDKAVQNVSPGAADLLPSLSPEDLTQETMTSLAGEGALRAAGKLTKPLGKLVARGLEKTSGLKNVAPGILEEISETPSKLFRTRGPAKDLYKEATKDVGTIFRGSLDHGDIVKKAQAALDAGDVLTPKDALIARKSVDKMIRSGGPKDTLLLLRNELDSVAKSSKTIARADKLQEGAVRSEAARELFPISKRGNASELARIGSMIAGASKALVGAPFFSPLTQSTGAASLGTIRKILPFILARTGNRTLEDTLNGRE